MAGPSDTSCSCTQTHMRIAYVIRSFFVPSPKTKWPWAPVPVCRVTPPLPRHRARPAQSALRLLPALALCAAVASPTARSWVPLHAIENSLSQVMTALSSFADGNATPGDAPPWGADGAAGGPGTFAPAPPGPGGEPPPHGQRGILSKSRGAGILRSLSRGLMERAYAG